MQKFILTLIIASFFLSDKISAQIADSDSVIVFVVPKDNNGRALDYFAFKATAGEWRDFKYNRLKTYIKDKYNATDYGYSYMKEGECGCLYTYVTKSEGLKYAFTKNTSWVKLTEEMKEKKKYNPTIDIIFKDCLEKRIK